MILGILNLFLAILNLIAAIVNRKAKDSHAIFNGWVSGFCFAASIAYFLDLI